MGQGVSFQSQKSYSIHTAQTSVRSWYEMWLIGDFFLIELKALSSPVCLLCCQGPSNKIRGPHLCVCECTGCQGLWQSEEGRPCQVLAACLSPSLRHSFCQCPLIVKTFNCVSFRDYMCECLCACFAYMWKVRAHSDVDPWELCAMAGSHWNRASEPHRSTRLHLPRAEVTGMLQLPTFTKVLGMLEQRGLYYEGVSPAPV